MCFVIFKINYFFNIKNKILKIKNNLLFLYILKIYIFKKKTTLDTLKPNILLVRGSVLECLK
jgi:hypothetical protein